MGLNEVYSVSKYFEILRVRHVVLYLLRPHQDLHEFADENKNIRLASIKIKSDGKPMKQI